jgi:hypothetical protein
MGKKTLDCFFFVTKKDLATLTTAKSFFNGGSSSRPSDHSSSKSYPAMVENKFSYANFTA